MELKIEQLCVELKGQPILKNIDLYAGHAEMIALLGASGCGKSTLLKSIAGLAPVGSGNIHLGDRRLNELAPEKRGTVIVFQDLRLFPHLSVERNIRFAMEIRKKSAEYQRQQVKELLKLVQLEGYEKRRIKEISGGQMQRVALARALASEPDLLLLDEPFSGLDERLRFDMADLVRKIQKEKQITTILVTHDKSEALRIADRVALMKAGKILQMDPPIEIFENPNSLDVAQYFGKVNVIGDRFLRPGRLLLTEGSEYRILEIAFLGEQVELVLEKNPLEKEGDPIHEKQERSDNAQNGAMESQIIFKREDLPDKLFCTMSSKDFYTRGLAVGRSVSVRGV